MSGVARALREAWLVIRSEVTARWGGFCLLTLLILAGYASFIFSMVVLNAGATPNYARGFRVWEGLGEVLTLSMPLWQRYELLAEQPLFEFGYRHPVMGSLEGVYTLTLHALLNLLLMSALIAVYCLLMNRALRIQGFGGRTLAGFGLGGGGSALGVVTAGAATVACCGGAGASVLLSLLGAGAGIGHFLAEHDQAFGAFGVVLMLVTLWFTVKAAGAGACVGRRGN